MMGIRVRGSGIHSCAGVEGGEGRLFRRFRLCPMGVLDRRAFITPFIYL